MRQNRLTFEGADRKAWKALFAPVALLPRGRFPRRVAGVPEACAAGVGTLAAHPHPQNDAIARCGDGCLSRAVEALPPAIEKHRMNVTGHLRRHLNAMIYAF